MSSDDDLVAKELRDRQETTEAVGTLRELERHCANAYARFLAALTALAAASLRLEAITGAGLRGDAPITAARKHEEAFTAAHDIAAELDLLAPGMHELAADALEKAHGCMRGNRSHFSARLAELRTTMRRDLPTPDTPNFRELDGATHANIGIPAPSGEITNPVTAPTLPSNQAATEADRK